MRENPQFFLGLNDGLVEILGAVSGFFGAFGEATMVLIAASTTAVAGALSMAAGAFLALNSEKEVKTTEIAKKIFLGEASDVVRWKNRRSDRRWSSGRPTSQARSSRSSPWSLERRARSFPCSPRV